MKFKKYASKKVVAIVMATMVTFGSLFGQSMYIKHLKTELNQSKAKIERMYDKSSTQLDLATLRAELNKQCTYKILNGKVNIKHSYEFTRKGMLGVEQNKTLVGTADFYYELSTDLRNSVILSMDDHTITIQVDKPTVDKDVCHRIANTFRRMDNECTQSLLSNRKDAELCTRLWEDTFDEKGYKYVCEYYTYFDANKQLMQNTEQQIQMLFKNLGYSQRINVVINNDTQVSNFEGEDTLKKQYGFIEFENINEFKTWLNNQQVKRNISRLQVHHTYSPAYKHWATDNALRRQNGMKSYHMKTNGWNDIAQHFTIFPDGHIVTGRSLEKTPVGIKGWNSNAICIEIYGDFDNDEMKPAQKEAIIGCYALLAKKFNVPINSTGIRPHCWFTAGGTYLGDYNASRSAKTCPGKKFFGGNTKKAFEQNFYPALRNYQEGNSNIVEPPATNSQPQEQSNTYKYIVKYLQLVLNEQYDANLATDGIYGPETEKAIVCLKQGHKGVHVEWLQKALVNRGHKINVDGDFGPATHKAVMAYQQSRNLVADGLAGVATHKAIIND